MDTAPLLLLALTRPDGAPVGLATDRDLAVAAGAIVDLVRTGGLRLTDDRRPRVEPGAAPSTPLADVVLTKPGRRLDEVLGRTKKELARAVGEDLAAHGEVGVERHRLGLSVRYPLSDPASAERVRADLTAVVAGGRQGTPEQVAALGVARAAGCARHLVDTARVPGGRALDRRVDALVDELGDDVATGGAAEVSAAVRAAVRAANTVVMAAAAGAAAAAVS